MGRGDALGREGIAREPGQVRLHVWWPVRDAVREGLAVVPEQGPGRLFETLVTAGEGAHETVGALLGLPRAIAPGMGAARVFHQAPQRCRN